ncbi:hypothetical protein D3C85_827980 [compost metagenome]
MARQRSLDRRQRNRITVQDGEIVERAEYFELAVGAPARALAGARDARAGCAGEWIGLAGGVDVGSAHAQLAVHADRRRHASMVQDIAALGAVLVLPAFEQQGALIASDDVEAENGAVAAIRQCAQQYFQLVGHALDGGLFEQVGVIVPVGEQSLDRLGHDQRQVDLGGNRFLDAL